MELVFATNNKHKLEELQAMLGDKIKKHNTIVYLINTGWSGGPYGVGDRIKIKYSRAMVTAALTGALDIVEEL